MKKNFEFEISGTDRFGETVECYETNYRLTGVVKVKLPVLFSKKKMASLSEKWGQIFSAVIEKRHWDFVDMKNSDTLRERRVKVLNNLAADKGIGTLEDYEIKNFENSFIKVDKLEGTVLTK